MRNNTFSLRVYWFDNIVVGRNKLWNASITTNKRAKTEKFRHNDRQCVPSSPLTSGFLLFLQEY